MALTASEVLSLKHHLAYGNIGVGAFPYTSDGFQELFEQVVAPNLIDGNDTTASTVVVAKTVAVVSVLSLTGIAPRARLIVDVGEDAEMVDVKATGALTFTARFAKAHAAGGWPVSTMSGVSRLRWAMWEADRLWAKLQDSSITKSAGLQSVDRNRVVWFGGNAVLKDVLAAYKACVMTISDIVRVKPSWYYEDQGALTTTNF
jgi:hypothetical protein